MGNEELVAEIGASGYPASPTSGSEKYPHAQYAGAVYAALIEVRAEPVEWHTYDGEGGVLGMVFYFRPYEPEPMVDGRMPLTADPDHWLGHGLELCWTQSRGWSWSPLEEDSEPAWYPRESVPLAELAAPAAVADVALQLLDGGDSFAADAREWAYAPFLATALRETERTAQPR